MTVVGMEVSVGSPTFAEQDIAEMYDRSFSNLLSLWDGRPVQHAGYFDESTQDDYRAAAARISQILGAEAGIDGSAHVLDVGCGCGDFVLDTAEKFGCSAIGLDLSKAHVSFARRQSAGRTDLDVRFDHGSASRLPYKDQSFSHVMSQDMLYHVPDKPRSHAEMFRVLEPGGILALCDFLQPTSEVSEQVRPHIYDRMMRNGGYSLVEYQVALQHAGFEILLVRNLDRHFLRSYLLLATAARDHARAATDLAERRALLSYVASCLEIRKAVACGEFGWGLIVARRPDRVPPSDDPVRVSSPRFLEGAGQRQRHPIQGLHTD